MTQEKINAALAEINRRRTGEHTDATQDIGAKYETPDAAILAVLGDILQALLLIADKLGCFDRHPQYKA